MSLLQQMNDEMVLASEVTYGAAVKACSKGGEWQRAMGLLFDLGFRGLEPNLVVYTAAISSLEKKGFWETAVALLDLATAQALEVDVICISAAMRSAKRHWEAALRFFSRMLDQELAPDLVSLNILISSCEDQGLWAQSLQMLGSAHDMELSPNTVSFNAAISVCDKARIRS